MSLRSELVTTDTGIATGKNDTHTDLFTVHILLSQVGILQRITNNDRGLTLVNALDRTIIACENGQSVIGEDELSRVDLVALGKCNNLAAVEIAIILILNIKLVSSRWYNYFVNAFSIV